jgi:hypothetical protein
MTNSPFHFELNTVLRHIHHGFTGVALARTEYATGCCHYGLCPLDLDKEGKSKEWEWFDQQYLEIIQEKKTTRKTPTGGPAPNPGEW